jgi:hypothetical protein
MIALLVGGILGLTLFLADLGVANSADDDPTPTPTSAAAIECKVDGVLEVQAPGEDFDGDGLINSDEQAGYRLKGVDSGKIFPDPCEEDSDDDGLNDDVELSGKGPWGALTTENRERIDEWITDPTNSDHDGDGVSDGDEFKQYTIYLDDGDKGKKKTVISNPTMPDTDGDGLNDYIERQGWLITVNGEPRVVQSSALHADTDGDGLPDEEEYATRSTRWGEVKTDPRHTDTDGDGIKDDDEINGSVIHGRMILLDPTMKDTDGDGLDDKEEADDPKAKCDPSRADTDGDGRADRLFSKGETEGKPSLICGSYDQDLDGLPDYLEGFLGLDPKSPDTDGDGLDWATEIREFISQKKLDTDGDEKPGVNDETPNSSAGIFPAAANQSSDTSTVNGLNSEIERLEDKLDDKDDLLDKKNKDIVGYKDKLEIERVRLNESSSSQKPNGQDTGTESRGLTDLMLVVVPAGIALILGVGIGYGIWNRPVATDHILRQQTVANLRSDPDLRRQVAGEIRQEPAFVGQVRQEITNQLNQERGSRLQGIQSDLRNRLNSTKAELGGAVAAANRGIPDAMLEEAESLISPVSDNDRWAENLAVASSLIRNVSRYYLGHT